MIKMLSSLLFAVTFITSLLYNQIIDPLHPLDNESHTISEYCQNCHDCNTPTKETPCLVSCPRHGGKFTGNHSVQEGPKIVVLDQLVNLYGPVIFAHQLHASMSGMSDGCAMCHHYSETDAKVPACRTCHETVNISSDLHKPTLKGAYHRQCLNCHREWAHENACVFCHQLIKNGDNKTVIFDKTDIVGVPHPLIKAEEKYVYQTDYEEGAIVTFHHTDHADIFGQQCVDCHKGDSCCRCHEAGHEHKKIEHTKTCGSCHQEKENCNFCHKNKEQPPFNHKISTGWELNKFHVNNACQDCHGSAKSFVKPSTVCVDCHIHWEVGSFNHEVTGLILSEDHEEFECGDCHIDMDFDQEPNCSECHDEIEYPEYSPGDNN
ncbi:MAG: hypothetical protein ISR90_00305 [Candidatus Marinimicrobia bacterium]|nr:hypothetical protein [Candidatus Neomarinimicrobiota bacterium]MBL7022483.1 hypothetical protein [Candidatus Neomarinimicrobiota bacterium]MBL7108662.1 hypothetical protein [Candidatus Neomarinimicrobiota bacterium]